MTPNHIRAHPQDSRQGYVTVHTSASSYLPGQLVTVTVRSSRDFMGFLLQARSVGDPVLLGGSWALTPPGAHTLHCLSEDDTVTHSDKQLKRNLSFVWRAPDTPIGDVRFYITVVQSYFVYWAGIKSAVLHDGSVMKKAKATFTIPEKEGKYPEIVPRHSDWELGMLLGCSAGLGMALVVAVRYVYRKACGKQTQVTLNDREREYPRGDRGLIHVQECGDLVRVRKFRENSFVLLAEYDILATPTD
ncbi:reelin domain-containing protein 1 [Salarias fasciatus]|uniref:reelin domain-containing protein 1 n=1 Tax=Salarias fasciatus TaxID=181472 RepID=UPI001176DE15|nr:reelin domain-containing protein 1 [Salarias fasciatus]